MNSQNYDHWIDLIHDIGDDFESRAEKSDRNEIFVTENYIALKEHGFLSASIPEELGGAGVPHSEMCDILRTIAQYCGSTALALSMHQHLLSATIWKYKQGQGGEAMLKNVVDKQLVLVSTGARDWLESNGEMKKTDNGYLITAVKHFASQSSLGDVLVTSAPFYHEEFGWQVLHFPVPFKTEGVKVLDNWSTLGMRGTGSHSVELKSVFVPEASITLRRPKGEFHPFWNVVLTVAMPLIISVYVGLAQKAAKIAISSVNNQMKHKSYIPALVGAMHNELTNAELNLKDMIRITNDYDFKAVDQNGQDILVRKTNTANACISVVKKAMEIVGGKGFYRGFGLERIFRDMQAVHYHPLQEKEQQQFTGEFILTNEIKKSSPVIENDSENNSAKGIQRPVEVLL